MRNRAITRNAAGERRESGGSGGSGGELRVRALALKFAGGRPALGPPFILYSNFYSTACVPYVLSLYRSGAGEVMRMHM